jgi:predicted kinase
MANDVSLPMLIIFGGLPATGKTTIARDLARQLGATYLRIDTIEQAIRDSATATQPLNDEGYCVAYAVAEDNLRLGQTVIADSVNPLRLSRDAWIGVAHRAQARAAEVEVICSDPQLHRQRVETRSVDIPGVQPPTWEKVVAREYEPWEREHIVIDTAGRSAAESVEELREALPKFLDAKTACSKTS